MTQIESIWRDLLDKDDRTSPAEYPEMCLITKEELQDYMERAASDGMIEQINRALAKADFEAERAGDIENELDELRLVQGPLLNACKRAAEWLSGWASAEPYLTELQEAIAKAESAAPVVSVIGEDRA
jgi:hypothetical protein